jgi:hypothetical protein
MSDSEHEPADTQLERYLDGLLTESERVAVEESLRNDPALRERVELQRRIDASLVRLYPPGQPSHAHLEQLAAQFGDAATAATGRHRIAPWVTGLAAAAAIGAVLFVWQQFGTQNARPFFEPRPVAELYAQAVDSGFTPYYKCDEADRFAAVFDRRQGQPLKLLPLAEGTQMLGISYPGGLSRDSTAMLCRVDNQPVMVLVDRAQVDKAVAQKNDNPNVNVFREERDGLVFYEVTPFDSARVIDRLAIADRDAERL